MTQEIGTSICDFDTFYNRNNCTHEKYLYFWDNAVLKVKGPIKEIHSQCFIFLPVLYDKNFSY